MSGFNLKLSGTLTCPACLKGTELYNTCHSLVETTFSMLLIELFHFGEFLCRLLLFFFFFFPPGTFCLPPRPDRGRRIESLLESGAKFETWKRLQLLAENFRSMLCRGFTHSPHWLLLCPTCHTVHFQFVIVGCGVIFFLYIGRECPLQSLHVKNLPSVCIFDLMLFCGIAACTRLENLQKWKIVGQSPCVYLFSVWQAVLSTCLISCYNIVRHGAWAYDLLANVFSKLSHCQINSHLKRYIFRDVA